MISSVQSLSRVQLCDPMDCSTPGLPVHHQLPEFTQTHVHWVGDANQPSHPVVPFSSRLQSLPASGCFPMSQLFTSGGQSIGASASASVPPVNKGTRLPISTQETSVAWSLGSGPVGGAVCSVSGKTAKMLRKKKKWGQDGQWYDTHRKKCNSGNRASHRHQGNLCEGTHEHPS